MKKNLLLFFLLGVMCLSLCFNSCKKDDDDAPLVGTMWKYSNMNVDIKTNNSTFDATFKEYLQQALVEEFDGLTLQFRSDGICVSSYPDGEQEEDAYTVSGNTITMTEYDESYTYSISGNQLSATFDATEMLQEELGELEEPGMNIIINKATYTLIFKKQ